MEFKVFVFMNWKPKRESLFSNTQIKKNKKVE